jgi:hypothetical protein
MWMQAPQSSKLGSCGQQGMDARARQALDANQ